MSVPDYYRQLAGGAARSLDALIADSEQFSRFAATHNFGGEFETLISMVSNRPESAVFDSGMREFYFSLYAASSGSYRHAHSSLRLCFELFCVGILFSAHEIKLRQWLSGDGGSDINWASISDEQNGIFSATFLRAFHPELEDLGKQYRALSSKVYRECSEFVHGNVVRQSAAIISLSYNREMLDDWLDRAATVRLCVIFCFAGRYLRLAEADKQQMVEAIMMDVFGHLPAIQAIYL